jgi:methyl coenzyme M reductase subunit C
MLPAPKAATGAGNTIRTTQRTRSIVPRDERKKAMILALVSGITDKDYQDIAVAKFATL